MSRLFFGLFAAALIAVFSLPSAAQDKKEQPKKLERIAIADPKEAAMDSDFAVQGEYEGETKSDKPAKFGAHVIAKGAGQFDVKIYNGGLPGSGWDLKAPSKLTGKRDAKRTDVFRDQVQLEGSIVGETFDLPAVSLKKVTRKSKTLGEKPPAGAVVLFGGVGDEKNWDGGKIVELSDGKFLNMGIKSKQKFQAFKAHVEFRLPWMPNSTGQGRANSGVYLQDRYEVQVLDSFGLNGENNECGGIYTQHKPLVNMCFPPMSWQTYDIEFVPAQFDGDKKTKNGRLTLYHNGVKIHDNVEFPKECPGGQKETSMPGPFQFQNHGDPVYYNNVWVVEVK